MPKKISRKGLVRKLDSIVTQILRLKGSQCVTCGSKDTLGTSHIFSRKNYSTRWDISDDGNNHLQCWPCNYKHSMVSTYPYNMWYVHKFGQDKFDDLYQRWIKVTPMKDWQLKEKLDDLKLTIDTTKV